ncbi:hypothetical protein [Epilithonimonas sp. UC225_85]|uniref:hypothetical protein n=1 Tax=Epilithonimonas sp. UC225_85 TaxID=3350167 RepID=UPI0036D24141
MIAKGKSMFAIGNIINANAKIITAIDSFVNANAKSITANGNIIFDILNITFNSKTKKPAK